MSCVCLSATQEDEDSSGTEDMEEGEEPLDEGEWPGSAEELSSEEEELEEISTDPGTTVSCYGKSLLRTAEMERSLYFRMACTNMTLTWIWMTRRNSESCFHIRRPFSSGH